MLKLLTIIFLISAIIIPFVAYSDSADFKTGLNNNKLSSPGFGEGITPNFLEYMGWTLKILFFAVIISAVVMIVIGGLEHVIAGSSGNPEDIKNARNRITMAIGGVLLAFASWIILNTINPDLLKTDIKLPGAGKPPTPAFCEDGKGIFNVCIINSGSPKEGNEKCESAKKIDSCNNCSANDPKFTALCRANLCEGAINDIITKCK